MCGYVRADPTGLMTAAEDELYDVGMVNREISPAFESLVGRATSRARELRRDMRGHFLSGDPAAIRDDIQFVLGGISMDSGWAGDGREAHDRYKNAISSAMRAAGMAASEEAPKGFGRCDVFVPGSGGAPALAMEIKTSSKAIPEISADAAQAQIEEKGYASKPLDGKVVWVAVGIRGKRVSVVTPKGFTRSGLAS